MAPPVTAMTITVHPSAQLPWCGDFPPAAMASNVRFAARSPGLTSWLQNAGRLRHTMADLAGPGLRSRAESEVAGACCGSGSWLADTLRLLSARHSDLRGAEFRAADLQGARIRRVVPPRR
jgi:hypothetical protein